MTYPVNAKVQDRFSEGLLLNLIEEGPKVLATPDDLEVRSNIMWTATQALSGILGVGVPQDWTSHMIGHELTGNFGIDHARSLSIILPSVMHNQRHLKEAKLLQYAERIFDIKSGSTQERIDLAISKTIDFFKSMDVPTSLADVSLDAASIETILSGLEAHKMTALGEHGSIDLIQSRAILEHVL